MGINWKVILPYIVIVGMVIASVQTCSHMNTREKVLLSNLQISRDSVHHFKGKNDELINRVQSIEITAKDLKDQAEVLGIDNKQLKDKVGSLNNLVAYYKGQVQVGGTAVTKGKDTVIYVQQGKDSIKTIQKKFPWTNGYLTLDQLYNPINDSLKTKYTYQSEFEYVLYRHRPGPFRKKVLLADFSLKDKNAKLSNATSILIKEQDKKFYQKWWFYTLIGFGGGVYFSTR